MVYSVKVFFLVFGKKLVRCWYRSRGSEESPSSYRPICLLNTLGKLYEAVIPGKLERELIRNGGLYHTQFGFRKARSTIDAVQELIFFAGEVNSYGEWARAVCLDVKNAFNSAPWDKIMEALDQRRIDLHLFKVI